MQRCRYEVFELAADTQSVVLDDDNVILAEPR